MDRAAWNDEPAELAQRIIWNVQRLLQWIDAAASDQLASAGDPNELPAGTGQFASVSIGFDEREFGLVWWSGVQTVWGIAELSAVPDAERTWVVGAFLDPSGRELRRLQGSSLLESATRTQNAIWLKVPSLPVQPPYRSPTTWAELAQTLKDQALDLAAILEEAGTRFRASGRHNRRHTLLLGFPFAERIGEMPSRMHWLAIGGLDLASQTEKRNGFRPIEQTRRLWDRQIAISGNPLAWHRTTNWAPDQIRRRGAAEDEVCAKRMLILGAGSLGSAVADTLLRMGVTNIGIMDEERLEIGNLSRHILTMRELGHFKAVALAERLNASAPDAMVQAMPVNFPPSGAEPYTADLKSYDVIIDCTGADAVLEAMAKYPWDTERLFVSLSMTWQAEGLLAYAASEASFPAIDAKERFAATPAPPIEASVLQVDGIGCWNPVFPATADDVRTWAAIGAKFIRAAVLDRTRRACYWRRRANGGIDVIDA